MAKGRWSPVWFFPLAERSTRRPGWRTPLLLVWTETVVCEHWEEGPNFLMPDGGHYRLCLWVPDINPGFSMVLESCVLRVLTASGAP